MSETTEVLHIVNRDKFTAGYINFMQLHFKDKSHTFLMLENSREYFVAEADNIWLVKSYRSLFLTDKIRKKIYRVDMIIVSGVFSVERYLVVFPKAIAKKIFLHFWGGDFYRFRGNELNIIGLVSKCIMTKMIKKCNSVIMLIENDIEEFDKIFGVKKNYFVASMPFDPCTEIDYMPYRYGKRKNKRSCLIGNSATEENQHMEMLHIIAEGEFQDIDIYLLTSQNRHTQSAHPDALNTHKY